ncbi:transposase [Streptomyces sp. NPDC014744]|uniref:transposase n=1 Tax=Streptomyces sp. NPDC014744 TaxID=3364903 RepID=UPI0036FBA4B1
MRGRRRAGGDTAGDVHSYAIGELRSYADTDDLWERVAPSFPARPPRRHRYPGRLPADDRAALRGIVYVLCKSVSRRDVPAEQVGCSGVTARRRRGTGPAPASGPAFTKSSWSNRARPVCWTWTTAASCMSGTSIVSFMSGNARADTTTRLRSTLTGHEHGIWSLATAVVDGRPVAVTGSHDETVRIWDLSDGRPVGGPLVGHNGLFWRTTPTTPWPSASVLVLITLKKRQLAGQRQVRADPGTDHASGFASRTCGRWCSVAVSLASPGSCWASRCTGRGRCRCPAR